MDRSAVFALATILSMAIPAHAAPRNQGSVAKLDQALQSRPRTSLRPVRVIVQSLDVAGIEATERLVASLGGRTGRRLAGIHAVVAAVPEAALDALARDSSVRRVSVDRRIAGTLERTTAAVGARWVAEHLGFDGTGVGVAIIDSGVTRAHDDLSESRVVHFADFVDFQTQPHDRYGHGTHVAGIIAGNGHDSSGSRRGVAPGAHLVVLKALDEQGEGYISNAIAAMDYAIEQRTACNIRVINLSVAAGVYESYKTDPLTLAAGRAVDAGIVVVTSAGNLGRNAQGQVQYGGITAPGNAPWVLTVGAASHNGTVDRSDDTIAPFSSIGPSSIDLVAKPDLVAPGVGIESLADPGSTLFVARRQGRLWGTVPTAVEPYVSLSGTSMAAPVVAGTVALMLQANSTLTPKAVKAILQASAEPHEAYSRMAQGAGFLNARTAVEMARTFAENPAGEVLDELVDAYQPAEGEWIAPCDPSQVDCRYLEQDCTVAPGCFEELAGGVIGVTAPAAESTVWGTRNARPVRRRSRTSGPKR
jgi:serine protease AprX